MNAMKRAHEIRRNAAKKFNCKVSEIVFSICLEMAWSEIKENKKVELEGSEKQVSWANDIKSRTIKILSRIDTTGLDKVMFDDFKKKVETCNSAKWFIEHCRSKKTEASITIWMEEDDYSDDEKQELREGLGI